MNDRSLLISITGYLALVYLIILPLLSSLNVDSVIPVIFGLVLVWALTLYLVINRQKETIGITFRPLTSKWLIISLLFGIVLSLLVPVLTLLGGFIFPNSATGIDALPYPRLLIAISVITAGITEEVIFRGYLLTQLERQGLETWIAALLSGGFFVLIHILTWPLFHLVFVVIPLTVILIIIYVKYRNLLSVIIIHTLVDLPLVFL